MKKDTNRRSSIFQKFTEILAAGILSLLLGDTTPGRSLLPGSRTGCRSSRMKPNWQWVQLLDSTKSWA